MFSVILSVAKDLAFEFFVHADNVKILRFAQNDNKLKISVITNSDAAFGAAPLLFKEGGLQRLQRLIV